MSTTETPIVLPNIRIRWMIRADMREVLAIEQSCFECPWSERDFLRMLRHDSKIGMVVEDCSANDAVCGYMAYGLTKREIIVLNFAVSSGSRRRGVGRQMVLKLIGKLANHHRNRLLVTVRETNLGGQLFFRAAGFRATEVFRGHYEESDEDGYGMEYRLDG